MANLKNTYDETVAPALREKGDNAKIISLAPEVL